MCACALGSEWPTRIVMLVRFKFVARSEAFLATLVLVLWVLQASLLIVQGQLGQFKRFSIKIDIKNRFWVIFDYNII